MSGKTRRGSGEGSVYQDKNRVWHAKLTVGRYRNGKPRYKEFKGKRKADVIARLNSYRREYGDLSLESGANMSFADYITRWIENVKRNEQKEATYIRTVSTANTYIIPMIGGYKVAELSSDIIQLHLINEMRDMTCERTGEELSWSSMQEHHLDCADGKRLWWKHIFEDEKVEVNPNYLDRISGVHDRTLTYKAEQIGKKRRGW